MCNAFIDRMELKNYSVFSAWFNWFEEREFISCIRLVQFFTSFSFLFICWDALPRWKGIIRLNLVGNQHSNFARIQACSKSKREFFVFVWFRILFFLCSVKEEPLTNFYFVRKSSPVSAQSITKCNGAQFAELLVQQSNSEQGYSIWKTHFHPIFFCQLFLLMYLHRKENLWLCEAFSSST